MAQGDFGMPTAVVRTQVRKPKTSIYTMLLVVALVALLLGCLLMYLEIQRYGGFGVVR